MHRERREERARPGMPPRLLPWLYFAAAHLSLALAFAAIAWNPRAAAGFFYHARLAGIVHLVTLGWVTASILGALYFVGPLALRTPMPSRWPDRLAFGSFVVGVIGMVAHFWIDEWGGMAWSGAMVAAGILLVGGRTLRGLLPAPVPRAVRLHVLLAFLNIGGAATMGVLLGFDKVYHFLPGYVLANVAAHAHLAAVGWASMMVVGVGYRLLPMWLPARAPEGLSVYASAVLLEIGAVGLFITLLWRSTWTPLFALVTAAGFAAFGVHVRRMLRQRRPRPPGLPAVDYAMRHAWMAFACLAVTVVLGLVLAVREPSAVTMRLALAYGVFGLVGFLAQMVAGMQVRLLPLLAWYTAAQRVPAGGAPPPMTALGRRRFAEIVWLLWAWGVPALAAGFYFNGVPLLTAGALALEAAVLLGAFETARLARCAFRATPQVTFGQDDIRRRGRAARQPAVQTAEP